MAQHRNGYGRDSDTTAINTHGEIAGNSIASDGWHAVRWNREGRITDLGWSAQYINDAGEVAGYLDEPDPAGAGSFDWLPSATS